METSVENLEAMFLKSETDLEYIEKKLKLDFINAAAENGCPAEENPALMLEKLKAIKAQHTALCSQVKEIAEAQQQSMASIRSHLSTVMGMVQQCQDTADVEVMPPSESVQEAAKLLGTSVCLFGAEVPPAEAASDQKQPQSREYGDLTADQLEAVPFSVRSNMKLCDLNLFYHQLQQHYSQNSSGSLSVPRMKQMKMKVSDAKLKVLQHLSVIELDKKGHVRLVL